MCAMIKRCVTVVTVLFLFLEFAQAAPIGEEAEAFIPEQAEELLDGWEDQLPPHELLLQGIQRLGEKLCDVLSSVLRRSLSGAVSLLAVVLLCSLVEESARMTDSKSVIQGISLAGALAITLVSAGDMKGLMGQSVETIDSLHALSKSLLPVLSAALAASGGVISAGFRQVAGVVFADVLITLIQRLLMPLVYFQVIAAAADAMFSQQRLRAISQMIAKLGSWLLTGMLVLYTAYLSLIGAMTSSADRLTLQFARSAMGAVPVVGGIISDAAGTVLAGAATLKNSLGVVGMLSVLAVCLVPFLELAVQYLLYKLVALLAGTIGAPRLTGLIDGLGSAFGMLLGMTGACALLLLISAILSVTVVTS